MIGLIRHKERRRRHRVVELDQSVACRSADTLEVSSYVINNGHKRRIDDGKLPLAFGYEIIDRLVTVRIRKHIVLFGEAYLN